MVFVRTIAACAKAIGVRKTVEHVLPLLNSLVKDPVCMCVCMCMCVCVYVYMCICVYVYMCVCVYVCVYVCVCVCMCVCVYVYMCVCMCVCMYVCMCVVCVRMYLCLNTFSLSQEGIIRKAFAEQLGLLALVLTEDWVQ